MKKLKSLSLAIGLLIAIILYASIYSFYQEQRPIPVFRGINKADDPINSDLIDEFMVSNLRKTGLPGVSVSITKNDKVIYTAGYGKDSKGNPITADTKMYIGSVSKSFTSFAVMQLVEEGKIKLEETVKSYLPDYVTKDKRSESITVSQLLNQSSGLADKGFPEMSLKQPHSLSEEMKRLSNSKLVADPGTQWNYHNPNYHILARLVEEVSGQPYNQYIKDNILHALNMDDTTSMTFAEDASDVERGYTFFYGMQIARNILPHFVNGSGGIISSANDMAKWILMQNNHGQSLDGKSIISNESIKLMHTPSGPDNDYAYGWEQDILANGSKRIEHGGTLFTYSSDAALFPESGYSFMVMFNSTSASGAEQQSFIDGLTSIVQNETPKLGLPVSFIIDMVLGVLTVFAIVFFVHSFKNANKWAERFYHRRWLRLMRNIPYVISILIGIFLLNMLGALFGGRDITLTTLIYGWSSLLTFVGTLAIGSLVLLISRILNLVNISKEKLRI